MIAMSSPTEIPNQEQIVDLLLQEGAPPRLMLDIGGSQEIEGDGVIYVALNASRDGLVEVSV